MRTDLELADFLKKVFALANFKWLPTLVGGLEHDLFFHSVENVFIFFRGVEKKHQPYP